MSLTTKSLALVLSNCSFYWSQQSLYLLKGLRENQREVLFRSAESKPEQDILQYVHNKQHPPVSQAIACQHLMTEWCWGLSCSTLTLLPWEFVPPQLQKIKGYCTNSLNAKFCICLHLKWLEFTPACLRDVVCFYLWHLIIWDAFHHLLILVILRPLDVTTLLESI